MLNLTAKTPRMCKIIGQRTRVVKHDGLKSDDSGQSLPGCYNLRGAWRYEPGEVPDVEELLAAAQALSA